MQIKKAAFYIDANLKIPHGRFNRMRIDTSELDLPPGLTQALAGVGVLIGTAVITLILASAGMAGGISLIGAIYGIVLLCQGGSRFVRFQGMSPEKKSRRVAREGKVLALNCMGFIALEDGIVSEAETRTLCHIFESMFGLTVRKTTISAIIEKIENSESDAILKSVRSRSDFLSFEQRKKIFQACLLVNSIDQDESLRFASTRLEDIGRSLRLDANHQRSSCLEIAKAA